MPTVTIDGREIEVPPGTNLIEAARQAGVDIPSFCYHPYLSVVGQCRICLVEVEGQPRLAVACATPVTDGMVVRSETSPRVKEARQAVMEFLLANHPLDCPVCDQAGECLLQDHSFTHGRETTGMVETRRTFPGYERRVIGPHLIQNQNRCIHCSRCIRFTREISETAQLTCKYRGNHAFIDTFAGKPFDDPFSGCAADVCPAGALTTREFRFRAPAWRLHATASVCPGCSIGCNLFIHHHDRVVARFMPRDNPDINAAWLCDHGRFLADSLNGHEVTRLQVREGADLRAATWAEAVRGIAETLTPRSVRVVASAGLSNEELYLARELFVGRFKADMVVPALSGEPRRMKNARGEWLESTDARPNLTGARRMGIRMVDGGALVQFLYGAADLTLILDPEAHPLLADDEVLQLLAVGTTAVFARTRHPAADTARWLLPLASLACNSGTFTAATGAVQRFDAAFPPPGDARPLWFPLTALARAAGAAELDLASPAEVFARMAETESSFAGLRWDDLRERGRQSPGEQTHVG